MDKSSLKRPNVIEKSVYEPQSSLEEFMVPLLREYIEKLLSMYAQPKTLNSYVLDVGCGRQPFRKNLENLGYNYRGLDVQQNPEGNVNFICEIDKPLPPEIFSSSSYEFILCTEVMEHVVDWYTAFKNFDFLLASGGRLLITCPHFYPLHEEPYDFWRPTPHALRYFSDKFGFKVLTQINAGDDWAVLGTFLGNCAFLPVSRRLSDRALTKAASWFRSFLFHLLVKGHLQKSVKICHPYGEAVGKFYLSNILVIEK